MKNKEIDLSVLPDLIVEQINNLIIHCIETIPNFDDNAISDKYHTFRELYDTRKAYNVALFNSFAIENSYETSAREGHNATFADNAQFKPLYNVHKSKKHFDGEDCFGGGWFIVVAVLPTGQISNHYKLEDWDLFNIPETEKALFEFDGHTTKDVIERLIEMHK